MPTGNDPPDPDLPQSVFDAVHAMAYDSTAQAFKNTSGTKYWLFVQKKSGGSYDQASWFYATETEGASNPKGLIDQNTFNVISGGTFNSSNNTISYQNGSYRVRLKRDSTNKLFAEAHTI